MTVDTGAVQLSAPDSQAPRPGPTQLAVRRRRRVAAAGFHTGMIVVSIIWMIPVLLLILVSVRSTDDIAANGLSALAHSFTGSAYREVWGPGGERQALINSLYIAVPVVLLEVGLGSLAAYALSRYRIPGRRAILLLMLGGNLLPPQILLIPVFRFSEQLGIYDTLIAVIGLQVGFGIGFFTFVLHGFMQAIPSEIQQAALIDGAGVVQIYWRIILPLARPALAALSALAFTWSFNDLLFAITVLRTSTKMPVTPALLSLQGQYVSSWNVIAAGTLIAAIPTIIVFLLNQRHFVGGLMLGSVK